MQDSKEFSNVGKSILGISQDRTFGQHPYGSVNQMGDTTFSHSSTKPINIVAYGPDGKAFGVVPKELIDQIDQAQDDWSTKNIAIESILEIVQETSSMQIIASYAPSFLKYLCRILNGETNSKVVGNILQIINKVLAIDEVLYKLNSIG